MIVFRRIFASLFAQPLGAARAATKGLLAFVDVTRDALGLVDELFFIPVVVVDVGAVETLNRLGGAGAGFDGLEHAEAIRAGHLRRSGGPCRRRGWLTCPGITPRWAAYHPRPRPSTISRTSHLHSEGKL